MIYLDHAATTKVKPEVVAAMMPYLTEQYYNPSSLYSSAAKIKEDIERARKIVGNFIGANSKEIYFCSCGSEADNWAVKGVAKAMTKNGKKHLVTTTIEHHAVLNSMRALEEDGFRVTYLPVDRYGMVSPEQIEDAICSDTALVSVMYANNEIGSIEPIVDIGNICRNNGVLFHTDAVQATSNIEIDVEKQNIDLLSMSGHKFGAPKGIAALYIKNGTNISNLIDGGLQMDGFRSGTENVPYIIGMAKAIELCTMDTINNVELLNKRDYFINKLVNNFGCKLNGHSQQRLSNNINVTFPQNITGESLLYLLDTSGIFISTGSACDSKSISPSHVLKSIGLTNDEAMRTIRITISNDITYNDIDKTIEEIDKIIKLIES